MSKFIALLPDELTAEKVTKELGNLKIDNLDWSIVDETNHERILPGFAWPGTTAGGTTGAPAAPVVVNDNVNSTAIGSDDVGEADSAYFTRAISHGSTAIVVDVPDEHDSDVHALLRSTEASSVVKE